MVISSFEGRRSRNVCKLDEKRLPQNCRVLMQRTRIGRVRNVSLGRRPNGKTPQMRGKLEPNLLAQDLLHESRAWNGRARVVI